MMARLLLLFCRLLFIFEFLNADTVSYYAIPEPNIEVFRDGGLRVSIKDEEGINTFRFHANINEEMKQLYPGTINIETSEPTNGKWILEDRSAHLKVGDDIYYWIFVEKERFGYVKQPVHFKVTDLVPYYNEDSTNSIYTTPSTPRRTRPYVVTTPPRTATTSVTPCPAATQSPIIFSALQNQIDALNKKIDLITSISALQGQVDTLAKRFDTASGSATMQSEVRNISKTVDLVLKTLETLPETRRLTLSGVVPPDLSSNPDQVVRMVLWEKLDLKVNVVTAVRQNDGSIIFELKTLQEKFSVQNAAEEKLKGSRISIT